MSSLEALHDNVASQYLLEPQLRTMMDCIINESSLLKIYYFLGALSSSYPAAQSMLFMVARFWFWCMILQGIESCAFGLYFVLRDHNLLIFLFNSVFHAVQCLAIMYSLYRLSSRIYSPATKTHREKLSKYMWSAFCFAVFFVPLLAILAVAPAVYIRDWDYVVNYWYIAGFNVDFFGSILQAWVLLFLLLDIEEVSNHLLVIKEQITHQSITRSGYEETRKSVLVLLHSNQVIYNIFLLLAYMGGLLVVINITVAIYYIQGDPSYNNRAAVGLIFSIWIMLLGRDLFVLLIIMPKIVRVNELFSCLKQSIAVAEWDTGSADHERVAVWVMMNEYPIGFPLCGVYVNYRLLVAQCIGLVVTVSTSIIAVLSSQVHQEI